MSRNLYSVKFVANISPAFMASIDELVNGQERSGWAHSNSVYTGNISSPHQTPPLRHRASTGQLNQVAYPGTPIPMTQTPYAQWNQSPNTYAYWHPVPTRHHIGRSNVE